MSDEMSTGVENVSTESEGVNEGADTSENSEVSPEVEEQPEQVQQPRKYKVKLDEDEMEVDEDELLRGYTHAKAANRKFQEAAAERKRAAEEKAKAERLYQQLKTDPFKAISELGLNPRELSEEFLLKELEKESWTPEQKKAFELEQKVKEYETKEQERERLAKEHQARAEAEKEAREQHEMTEKIHKEYETKFIETLQSSSLPRNPTVIRRVAEVVFNSLQEGYEIPVEQAVKIVEKDMRSGISDLIRSLDGDRLIEFLGDDTVKKLRKHDAAKVKNPIPNQKSQPKEEPKPKKSEYIDSNEWYRQMMDKYRDE